MATVWVVMAVAAVGISSYALISGEEAQANHMEPVNMEEQFSLQQLPGKRKIVKRPSGLQYAGTESGIFVSRDGGMSWKRSYPLPLPVTMITALDHGDLYAFVVGKGLYAITGDQQQWSLVNNRMGAQVLLSLSESHSESNRDASQWVAQNQYGKRIYSEDGGQNWAREDGLPNPVTTEERKGERLFKEKCQSCHGERGVGETYTIEALTSRDYIMAPPLDESAHAWHHTDEALIKTILEGSSRPSRMPAWGPLGVTRNDANHLIAYIKTLWGDRIKGCQGPKHMQCM